MTVHDKDDRVKDRTSISTVCRQWKNIVDNTPLLWSLVYIELTNPPSRASWELAMEHSGTQSLDITVRADGVYFESEASVATEVMELLIPHMRRWKLIHVSLQDLVVVKTVVSQWKDTADVLEEIFLSSEPECESDAFAVIALNPKFVAPKLRVFVLVDIPLLAGGEKLHKHFPILDELSLVRSTFQQAPGCNWPKCMPLLKDLKHLRLLNLAPETEGDDDDDDDGDDEDEGGESAPDDGSLPMLPSLEELAVHDMSLLGINKLLGAFTAPRLAKIEIATYESADDEEERLPKMKALLRRFPSLRTLRLDHSADTLEIENIRFLGENFERLEIVEVDVERLIQTVTKRAAKSKWPIPRLKLLEVEKKKDVSVATLRKLVEVCNASEHPITSLVVRTADKCPQKDRAWFEGKLQKFDWISVGDSYATASGSVTLVYGPKA
ncbi:hypothetical protein DAEQUDRAFT_757993 [Daedalea quercina L-15889]|uniref:Uncharacterized protein n=1 Tax=Daedalea quercina L-15889 TaxID=1314783 RepID=A0A165P4Q7_9APHY|nr:hypothetical protein DAEQUDRAFT_757993 [Daedalea quercina L-15889]